MEKTCYSGSDRIQNISNININGLEANKKESFEKNKKKKKKWKHENNNKSEVKNKETTTQNV
jgi:hypothetical protein